MKKEVKGKCRYCGREIDPSCIRCDNCNFAWQEGFEAGQEDIKSRLREIRHTVDNFTK